MNEITANTERTMVSQKGRFMDEIGVAYDQLRDDIISGRVMPNERLVEIDLSERLSCSRTTVRTILIRLEHEGLVVREPNRGAHVRLISEEEAVEITEARAALEALASYQAALHADADDIAEIQLILAEMAPLLEAGDLLSYSNANRRLHARILEASRHSTVQRLVGDLKAQLVRFQYRTILVPGRSQHSLAEHTALVDAISRHDPEAASAAMTTHLSGVASTLRATSTPISKEDVS